MAVIPGGCRLSVITGLNFLPGHYSVIFLHDREDIHDKEVELPIS